MEKYFSDAKQLVLDLRQHCRLSICEYWLSLTNTVSEQKITITILILKRGPCLIHTYNHKRWRERWHNHKRWRRSNQITLTRELTVVWRAWLRLRCTLHVTCNQERCVEGWRWQRNHFDSRIDSWLSRAVNCQSPTTNQFRLSLNLQDSLNSNYQLL